MEELENKGTEQGTNSQETKTDTSRQEIFSETVRAGKRTYFFDVKSTRAGEYYLTITESKRRFNNDSGKFFYEKHKLFLYKEDFEKFANGLTTTIGFIQTEQPMEQRVEQPMEKPVEKESVEKNPHIDVEFEDLGTEATEVTESTEDSDTQSTEETKE